MHFAILDIEEKSDEHGAYVVSIFDQKINLKSSGISKVVLACASYITTYLCY